MNLAPAHPASALRLATLTLLAMLAFAGNSLLCRLALKDTGIDAASFTAVRLVSGALVLALLVRLRGGSAASQGDWPSGLALFVYAAGFSFAYLTLTAATGALLLFAAVQVTMIGVGLWRGERLAPLQMAGFAAACAGLVGLLLPGVQAPSWSGAVLMIAAGAAWGVYSLRGRGARDPLAITAGNFWRAAVFSAVLSAVFLARTSADALGLALAVASGAITSGLGYAVWYTALRGLTATVASTVQLTVPVITAVGAVLWLGESLTLRLVLASVAVLGGVALVALRKAPPRAAPVTAGR